MERSDIDILAGRCRTLRAGDETIEIREPAGEFYLTSYSKIIEMLEQLKQESPDLAQKLTGGGKVNILAFLKLKSVSHLLFELLAMILPEGHEPPYTADWLRRKVGLRGLMALLNAGTEVIGVKEIADNFFVLVERLEEAFPEMKEKISTATKLRELQDSSET